MFSDEGRIKQVEYAMEAIGRMAGSSVGIMGKDGIVLITEKNRAAKLLEMPKRSEVCSCTCGDDVYTYTYAFVWYDKMVWLKGMMCVHDVLCVM